MNRATQNILILCLLSFVIGLSGCRPKGILHSWEMRSLLYDLHRTDALLQISGKQYESDEVRDLYYAGVLERHGVTQAQFDSSLVWYTAHPQLFDKIYPKVIVRLREDEQQFELLHAEELADNGLAINDEQSTMSESVYTQAQLDSTLWVTQHGYPSTWQPLVHNLENQLFPQIGVLR